MKNGVRVNPLLPFEVSHPNDMTLRNFSVIEHDVSGPDVTVLMNICVESCLKHRRRQRIGDSKRQNPRG